MTEALQSVDTTSQASLTDVGAIRLNRRTGVVTSIVLVAGLTAGALANAVGSDSDPSLVTEPTTAEAGLDNGCDVLSDQSAANDGDKYESKAFLPKYNQIDAKRFVDDLFDKNGPLSNRGDFNSLGAFMAVIGIPANDKKAVIPKINYGEEYKRVVAQYNSLGTDSAREDCAVAYATAVETAQNDPKWARAGDTVTGIHAIRDEENNIIGIIPEEIVIGEDLGGVSFAVRNTSDGVDGFTEVLVSRDGIMYVRGVTAGVGVEVIAESDETVSVDPTASTTIPVEISVVDSTDITTDAETSTSSSNPESSDSSTSSSVTPTGTTVRPNPGSGGSTGSTPASTPDAPGAPDTTTGIDVPATSGSTPATTGTTPGTTGTSSPNTNPSTSAPATTAPETTPPTTPPSTAPPTTQPPTTPPSTAPPTTEQHYNLVVCDLQQRRNEGGFGVVVAFAGLTAAERDAILGNPRYKANYTDLGDSNGDGQVICK